MAQDGSVLTPRQRRAIDALLSSRSVTDAAVAAQVPRRTLTRWLRDEPFIQALRDATDDATRHAMRRLAGALETAVTSVVYLAEKSEDDGVRLRAAVAVPDLVVRLQQHTELAERVAELERAVKESRR